MNTDSIDIKTAEIKLNKKMKLLRRRLFKITVPISILVLLIIVKLITPAMFTSLAIKKYNSGDIYRAHDLLAPVAIINIIEPYKVNYNRVIYSFSAAKIDEAELEFRKALDTTPSDFECQVRVNLVFVLMSKANQQNNNKQFDDAIITYDKIKAVIQERDCGLSINEHGSESKDGKNDGEEQTEEANRKLQQLEEDINKLQENAKQARNGDESQNDGSDPNQSEGPSQQQLDDFEQKQQENDQKNRKRSQSQRTNQSNEGVNDRSYDNKNW